MKAAINKEKDAASAVTCSVFHWLVDDEKKMRRPSASLPP